MLDDFRSPAGTHIIVNFIEMKHNFKKNRETVYFKSSNFVADIMIRVVGGHINQLSL